MLHGAVSAAAAAGNVAANAVAVGSGALYADTVLYALL